MCKKKAGAWEMIYIYLEKIRQLRLRLGFLSNMNKKTPLSE
jgi:hypothetical protein